jgi:hypothetical protein
VQAIEAALHIEAGSDSEAALPYGAAVGVWQPVAVADVVGNTPADSANRQRISCP